MIYCSQCNKYRQFNTVCRCDGTVSDVQDTLLKEAIKDKEKEAQITRINKKGES